MNIPIPPNGKAGKSSTQKWHFNGVYIYISVPGRGLFFSKDSCDMSLSNPGWFKNGTCMKYVYTYKSCSIGPPFNYKLRILSCYSECGSNFFVKTQMLRPFFRRFLLLRNLRSLMYQNQLALESGNNWTYNNLYTHFASKSQCTTYIPTVTLVEIQNDL